MRKGFNLVELLTVLAVLAVITIPLYRLFKIMVYDIPKSCKLIECNTSILDVLKCIGKDVGSATEFPKSLGKYTADDKCLLIKQQDETICYLIEQGTISRIAIGKEGGKSTWQIPDGRIEWQVRQGNGAGRAVEIKKYVELKKYKGTEKRMESSYVYFAGIYPEAVN